MAKLFATIGHVAEATRHVEVVPVASARMTCQMRCRMATARLAVERGGLAEAAAQLPPIEDLLQRAIGCGAMVDPWNILGFGGQYSLFPAVENSVADHRVDELLDMISDILGLYVQIHKAAAAAGDTGLQQMLLANLAALAGWWDKFAAGEIESVDGISGHATLEAAQSVAAALRAWHQGGAAAGDLAFWRNHVEHFRSPKAYSLVIDTLLDRRDPVAAMALLVQWLSQVQEIPLAEEDYSFHELALAWMEDLWRDRGEVEDSFNPQPTATAKVAKAGAAIELSPQPQTNPARQPSEPWSLAKKFLDYLEANAEEYWRVPQFELAAESSGGNGRQTRRGRF